MAKKRVHELAKELNLESKDLIARLEKMGISVKSHSSTLEDDDVEKIREALLSGDSHQIVEERIKSTVIRRRAVRAPVEEQPAPEEEIPAEEAAATPAKKEVKEKREAPEKTAAEPSIADTAETKKKLSKKEEAKTPAGPEAADAEKVKQPAAATPKPIVFVKHKITKPEIKKAPKPEKPQKPGEKIIVPPPEKSVKKEFDKTKRKGKAPVEVFIEEEKAVPRRKVLEKKTDKKLRKQDDDREVSFIKWRDEKKVAPVKMKKTEITVPKAIKRRIKIGDTISVGELAKRMGVKASEVINKLIGMGVMATINQSIDYDIASIVTSEFSFQVEKAELDFDESTLKVAALPENLKPRAPVVTIMGHVDHGKTSLLDAIRQSNVIDGEAGGITQAIGAYHVNINNRDIVFLDTPGHEAFTAMRARGAKVTDIVVLVVAADDGVMEQTIEAINHSKVAGVPIIVAVNKIDKPGAEPDKIKQGLSEHGLLSEKWGGDTIFCEVSAKKKQGIEELLEMILLQADVMELKADPNLPAHG
ncbi:MAG TPA: GTP-binding protein, partial [Deltaproteobacteria bacterium]|nr:GTP-binding protein [Deltaproteobacteria bacterium]